MTDNKKKWIFVERKFTETEIKEKKFTEFSFQGQEHCPCSEKFLMEYGYNIPFEWHVGINSLSMTNGCFVFDLEQAPSWIINEVTRYFNNLLK